MKNSLASYLVLSLLLSHLISVATFANDKVAKAIIARGNVKATLPDGTEVKIEKGSWLSEGAKVKTAPKSFVKFLFTDKSQMNLGPNSEMEIAKFDKKEAGIINLMKGSLRSKVTKNYLKEGEKDKSKLFVKTSSAAMGVRGTDFMVTFEPATNLTNLDVISGAVAMAPIDIKDIAGGVKQNVLENLVSGSKAVMVEKGQFSRAEPGMQKAPAPMPIPKDKLDNLNKNDIPVAKNINPFVINGKPVVALEKDLKNDKDKDRDRDRDRGPAGGPGPGDGPPKPDDPRPPVPMPPPPLPPPPAPDPCPDGMCEPPPLPPEPDPFADPNRFSPSRTNVNVNINQGD